MTHNVVVYEQLGRADKHPLASFDHDHALINELVAEQKSAAIARWRAEGRDLSACKIIVEGPENIGKGVTK